MGAVMKKYSFLFLAGSSLYPTLEMAWRGHTHISMAAAGGICLCLIDKICNSVLKNQPLPLRCFAGASIITGAELTVGIFVNLILQLNVWDYSHLPLNLMGQVCLPFTLLWSALTIPAMGFGNLCRRSKFLAG